MSEQEADAERLKNHVEYLDWQMKKRRLDEIRALLKAYHSYVAETFPVSGFCEASINNFIAAQETNDG